MIYGFLTDTMYEQFPVLDYGTSSLPPVCFLDDQIENYFNRKLSVRDPRTNRNAPTFEGVIKLHFDADKLEEDHIFTELLPQQLADVFSLFEKIYTAGTKATEILEQELTTDPLYSTFYVPDTLLLGRTYVDTGLPAEHPSPEQMVDCFSLEVVFNEVNTSFKIWMNRAKFAADYPLSTISKVILPCDHSYLLNPSKFANIVETIIKSNEFSFSELSTDITTGDHSGLLTYKTKYNVSSTTVKLMPFGILYKGAVPSSLDIREAIRTKLIGYGTAPAEVWESLFPDLFVTGQFFIVPVWDNVSVRTDRVMYPSICNIKKLKNILPGIFPNLPPNFVEDHQEVFTCAHSEIFLLSIPDPLNANQFSLLAVHPTYQFYSPQNQTHAYMEPKSKDFSIRLNRCMAVLAGETVLEEFVENKFDDRRYLSFVSYGIEYHILFKEDYLTYVESLS